MPDAGTQKIDSNGFSAKWAVLSLSSNNQAALISILTDGAKTDNLESLSIGFVEPIDVNSQSIAQLNTVYYSLA